VAIAFGHGHGGSYRQERSQVTVSQHLRSGHATPDTNEDHSHLGGDRPVLVLGGDMPAMMPARGPTGSQVTTVLVGQTGGQPGVHNAPFVFPMG
jgi:hypothetical protein